MGGAQVSGLISQLFALRVQMKSMMGSMGGGGGANPDMDFIGAAKKVGWGAGGLGGWEAAGKCMLGWNGGQASALFGSESAVEHAFVDVGGLGF